MGLDSPQFEALRDSPTGGMDLNFKERPSNVWKRPNLAKRTFNAIKSDVREFRDINAERKASMARGAEIIRKRNEGRS